MAEPPTERASIVLPQGPQVADSPAGSLSGWLLVLCGLVLGVDWLFPMRGALTVGLTVAISVLWVPWAIQVFRRQTPALAGVPPFGPSRPGRSNLPMHLGVIALGGGFLAAKWLLLYYSGGAEPDYAGSSQTYTLALALVMAFGLAGRSLRLARFLAVASQHPARLMALSFGIAGVVGALLLSLPMSMETMQRVSLVDNLFMAFSAVCVTGLSVTNISETYTLFGEIVLCALIQIGGLGIMVLSAALAVVAGQRLRVKSSAVLAEMVDATSLASLRRTVLMICVFTLIIEGIGAAVLHAEFQRYPELAQLSGHPLSGPGDALWAAIFHSVTAFCNAGLSNIQGGLMPLTGNSVVLFTLAALVVLGGIGFPVLDELARAAFTKLRGRRVPMLSLNTRIALLTSGILLGVMAVAYGLLEWTASMGSLPYTDRAIASVFQSAMTRSAGFNVVDVGAMRPAALILTCVAMFVGASPGSTGGGIKTTTLAALFAGLRAELRGTRPTLLNRRLPDAVIRKAISVSFLSMVFVTFGIFLLLLFESHPPLALAFEATSAFSTTGLSTGITPHLSVPGKLLITAMMFIGRIGPLTLALAVSAKTQERALELPEERVMIG